MLSKYIMRTTCSLILLSLEIFFLYSLWEHSVSSHKICQSGFILDIWAVRGAIPNCLQNLDYASFQFQHKATSLNTSVPKSTRKHWGDTSLSHLLTSKPGLHEEEVGPSKLQTEVFTEKKIYLIELVLKYWCYLVRNFKVFTTPDLKPWIIETQLKEEISFNGKQSTSHCRGPVKRKTM